MILDSTRKEAAMPHPPMRGLGPRGFLTEEEKATLYNLQKRLEERNNRLVQDGYVAQVQVSLSAGGQTLKTVLSDASGAYRFDSLDYGAGTQYTVSVTSQYGEFSYNVRNPLRRLFRWRLISACSKILSSSIRAVSV